MELSGFFTAHAVWTASQVQGPVVPMMATEHSGERRLKRFQSEDTMELAVQKARELLESGDDEADRGIVLYDAIVTIGSERSDALVLHGVEFGAELVRIELIQPYRPLRSSGGFAVMQPKVSFPDDYVDQAEDLIEAFFRGLDSHEEGGPLWSDSLEATG